MRLGPSCCEKYLAGYSFFCFFDLSFGWHTQGFLSDPLALVRRANEACGDCFTLSLGGKRMTFLIGAGAHDVFYNPQNFLSKSVKSKGEVNDLL